MRKFLLFVNTLACLLISLRVSAQYDNIRFPQKPGEAALFEKLKVMGETQYSIENGKKVPYFNRAFDPGGRLVISADYYHRQYFIYDDNNNVVSFLDSAREGSGFKAEEWKFKYYDNGKLMEMNGPGMHSIFKYDPKTRKLTEHLMRNDSAFTNVYTYDTAGRLVDALYLDFFKKPQLHIEKHYARDGRLFNETNTKSGETFSDSVLTIYEYNAKKQLYKKQRFHYQTFYFSENGSQTPDHSASHFDQGTSEFNLDDEGRPLEEEFSIKGDKLNFRYSSWKYDKNGLLIQETNRIGHAEPTIIQHEYVYFQ